MPHEFMGYAIIFPAVEPKLTDIEFVPDPAAIVAPLGNDQL